MQRRDFLNKTLGFSAISIAGMSGLLSSCADNVNGIKNPGIQLYTIRDMMSEDMEGSLAKVAEVGYKEVEFFNYYNRSATDVKNMLDQNGLITPSIHVSLEQIQGDALKEVIDYSSVLGQKYITLAWFRENDRQTLDQFKGYVDLFHQVGKECKKAGIKFAYHNHEFEFRAIDGVEPYDLFLDNVSGDLLTMEMDLYWIIAAGRDPLEYFDKYPGRFEMCHLKDLSADRNMVYVGDGTIDFDRILAQAGKAGLKHFFAEHDRPENQMDMMTTSYDAITKMRLG